MGTLKRIDDEVYLVLKILLTYIFLNYEIT